MIGAIIGDIVGARFEFGAPPPQGFQFFTDDSECTFTDDTICTIAVADAILSGKDYKTALLEWCRKYPDPEGGYGTRFYHWINTPNPEPNNSFGNGSAMRVSAVGWLFNDYRQVLEEARKSAEVSHNHPEGIKGAQCVAALIYWLRTCRITKSEVEKAVKKSFGYEIPPMKDILKIGSEGHFDGSCQETVPWAIRCFWMRKVLKRPSDWPSWPTATPTPRPTSPAPSPKPTTKCPKKWSKWRATAFPKKCSTSWSASLPICKKDFKA